MTISRKKLVLCVLAGVLSLSVLGLGERLSLPVVHGFVSTAEARVGRPLTPVSVAGVARRTARRCAAGVYNC
jgi:hypothetical protein